MDTKKTQPKNFEKRIELCLAAGFDCSWFETEYHVKGRAAERIVSDDLAPMGLAGSVRMFYQILDHFGVARKTREQQISQRGDSKR